VCIGEVCTRKRQQYRVEILPRLLALAKVAKRLSLVNVITLKLQWRHGFTLAPLFGFAISIYQKTISSLNLR
jgi:hypothetical protein